MCERGRSNGRRVIQFQLEKLTAKWLCIEPLASCMPTIVMRTVVRIRISNRTCFSLTIGRFKEVATLGVR